MSITIYRSGTYGRGSSPAYHAGDNSANTLKQAIETARDVLLAGGWTKTGDIGTTMPFQVMQNFAGYTNTPLLTIDDLTGTYYTFAVDSTVSNPGTYNPATHTVTASAPSGIDFTTCVNNLVLAINTYQTTTGWSVDTTEWRSPTLALINLYSVRVQGDGALSRAGYTPVSSAPNVGIYTHNFGAGFRMQSQTPTGGAGAAPINMEIRESGWSSFNELNFCAEFTDLPYWNWDVFFGLFFTISNQAIMAYSNNYQFWASRYAFAMWESNDVHNTPPTGEPPYYTDNRFLFVSSVIVPADEFAPEIQPCWFFELGKYRTYMDGLAIDPNAASATQFGNQVGTYKLTLMDNTPPNVGGPTTWIPYSPWTYYYPFASHHQGKLTSSNGTSVVTEALFGMAKGNLDSNGAFIPGQLYPPRVLGWIPDALILNEDRPLEEVIQWPASGSGDRNWLSWRTNRCRYPVMSPTVNDGRGTATLYLAT